MICEFSTFVLPLPLIMVRTPVMVPRGICCLSSMGPFEFLAPPGTPDFGLDRHDGRLKAERRRSLPLVYQLFSNPACSGILSLLARNKKNVRKAVAVVMIVAKFAATNCQYVSQMESIDSEKWPVLIPETRVMVQTMVSTIRPRETDSANFWVHRILIFHIRRNGMYKTWIWGKEDQQRGWEVNFKHYLLRRSPMISRIIWLTDKAIDLRTWLPNAQVTWWSEQSFGSNLVTHQTGPHLRDFEE